MDQSEKNVNQVCLGGLYLRVSGSHCDILVRWGEYVHKQHMASHKLTSYSNVAFVAGITSLPHPSLSQ